MGLVPLQMFSKGGEARSDKLGRHDVAPVIGLAAIGLVEIWLTPSQGLSVAERAVESAVLVVIAGCFVYRRAAPLVIAGLVMTLLTAVAILTIDGRAWAVAVLILMAYSSARHAGWTGSAFAVVTAALYGAVVSVLEDRTDLWTLLGNTLFMLVLMVLIPCAAGLALRHREQLGRVDADRAVGQERIRIARELHDVVGHALGVIVVQADGELASLPEGSNDTTRETLSAIAQCAREALDDVRRLLIVMRSEGSFDPHPGLADLPRLLAGMSAAGLPCNLVIEGAARPLSRAVDLSAYRVVQEALTNTLRHSHEANACVLISYLEDAIVIDVTDNGQAISGHHPRGFGLLGMRERVAVFGGEVQTGSRPEGGFTVHVNLPTGGGQGNAIASARL